MKNIDKRALYESIMHNVAIQVKKALHESFEFEKDDLGDALVEVINKNEAIMKVVKNADLSDYIELVREMQDIIQNDPKALKSIPTRITNLHSLAVKILSGANKKALKPFMVLKGAELQALAEYMKDVVAGGAKAENNPKSIAQRQDMQPAVECANQQIKECDKKKPEVTDPEAGEGEVAECDCKDGKCEKDVKECGAVSESRISLRARRRMHNNDFYKYL